MSITHSRLPRAGIDPIDDPITAASTIGAAMTRPCRHETIVLLLDAERRGVAVVVVSGTAEPDAVIEVLEVLVAPTVHDGRVAATVMASVRPDGVHTTGDVERWMELSDVADDHAVELIEWFVIGPDAVRCPRDELGEPPRW